MEFQKAEDFGLTTFLNSLENPESVFDREMKQGCDLRIPDNIADVAQRASEHRENEALSRWNLDELLDLANYEIKKTAMLHVLTALGIRTRKGFAENSDEIRDILDRFYKDEDSVNEIASDDYDLFDGIDRATTYVYQIVTWPRKRLLCQVMGARTYDEPEYGQGRSSSKDRSNTGATLASGSKLPERLK